MLIGAAAIGSRQTEQSKQQSLARSVVFTRVCGSPNLFVTHAFFQRHHLVGFCLPSRESNCGSSFPQTPKDF